MDDTRRAPRRTVPDNIPVVDHLREQSIGRLTNVSETGMLLLTSADLVDEALYQLSFPLPGARQPAPRIDVGVHLLWQEPAQAPGQSWAGFRFLSISDEHRQLIRQWVGNG